MDEARYGMWPTRKFSSNSHVPACSDSWEERAFAEDSAGLLGGCIWPPRSYSCSFCGREFRSAQALGGHMNIHRRDRARLRESSNQSQKPSSATIVRQYPSQVYNPKTNPNFIATPDSPSGVSVPSTQENCSEKGFDSLPTITQEQPKVSFYSLGASNSSIERENLNVGEMGCWAPKELVRTNIAWSTSDSIMRGSPTSDSAGEEEGPISSKRQKKCSSSPFLIQGERENSFKLFPFFIKPGRGERHLASGALGRGASAMEDLDLELRLGDRPKVEFQKSCA